MVVSTMYDADLKAKVFQIRDSERYVSSTTTTLSLSYNNNRRDYVTITMSALVGGHLGTSNVAFYCDGELLGLTQCVKTSGKSRVRYTAQVPYGYHTYSAKYLGNNQCLSSNSGIVELNVTERNVPSTNLSLTITGRDSSSWVNTMSNLTGKIVLTNATDSTVVTGKSVKIYFNDENYSTITTTSGETNITSILNQYASYIGEMNIKAVFEGDNSYNGCESPSVKVYSGYDFTAAPKYAKIGVGDEAAFDVSLAKITGTPVPNKTVKLRRD